MVAVKKSYTKVVFREIRQSISRFLAIFAISALGVGFLAGLLATTPDMRISADRYYDETNLMDIRVLSTVGLAEEDITVIRNTAGVADVMPAYSADALLVSEGDSTLLTRIHSLPFGGEEEAYLNRVELIEGRLPEKAGECVVKEAVMGGNPVSIGDTVRLSPDNADLSGTLAVDSFTVVGVVTSAYYMSIERETSNIGDGQVDLIAYTVEDSFCLEVYTDAFVTVKEAKEKQTFTEAYKNTVQPVADALETLGETQVMVRYDKVMAEANEKLDDARKQYEEGKAESDRRLQEAAAELEDARRQIADGERELEEGRQQIIDGERGLEEGRKAYEQGLADYNAGREAWRDGVQQLSDKKNDYRFQMQESQWQIYTGKQELASAKEQLDSAKAQLDSYKTMLDAAKSAIQQSLDSGLITQEQADKALAELQPIEEQYNAGLQEYNDGLQQVEENEKKLAEGEKQLEEGRLEAEAQFEEAQRQLDEAKAALDKSKLQLDDARREIEDNEAKLEQAKKDLETGEAELADARTKLTEGEAAYESGKQEAEEELADARRQIRDAESQLEDMAAPQWYVLDRDSNVSYASFDGNANKVEAIARIFPVFFFLVAALVALTTMTRMIEEERTQIGTLKALGYSKGAIMFKYVVYAGSATITGSIFGLLVGFQLLPTVIWGGYGIMYTLPKLVTQFNLPYALLSSLSVLLCTMLATVSACYGSLMEVPARLMLPKAPKAGKRVFLERIPFIWSRLKFTHKVTARNLFRYKKRFLMTVVGIAGCTALLVTGLGLRDSISAIVDKQFGEIFTYNLTVAMKNGQVPETDEDVKAVLEDKERIADYLPVQQQSGSVISGGKSQEAYLLVPEQRGRLKDFINLRERRSGKEVELSQDGAVLTEKLAETLKVQAGDTVEVENADGARASVKVTGIVENYVSGYVYMSPSRYQEVFGAQPDYAMLIAKVPDDSAENRAAVAGDLLKSSYVSAAQFSTDISKSFSDTIKSIDYIVMVLVVCAGLLAFVVLYNLTNINITERTKELATIKVLGFYDREVSAYIYRETAILSLIGTAVGLVAGIFLHAFVVKTAEVDMVMFGRSIGWLSYVLAAALTLFFSLLVNLVMIRKLKKIDMVESMKAGE